jgi:hypothetical protein
MFIGYINYYWICCGVAHISLNQIDPRFDNLFHGQTKCRKHLYNAYIYGCKSIACPDHNKWFRIHTNALDFQLGMCVIQEEGWLPTSLATDNVIAKLSYIGTVNTFHHSYSQRILKCAPQKTFTFYGT